ADPETDIRRYSLGANCGQCCGGVVEVIFEFLPGSSVAWISRVTDCYRNREPVVIATSIAEPGRTIVVGRQGSQDDFSAHSAACDLLAGDGPAMIVNEWLLEPVRQPSFQIAVFGAGHVGAATVALLSTLDCEVRWIDARRNVFPGHLPANITPIESPQPAREVAAMPSGSFYLVMTHSHPLDLDICARVLQRDDAAYCGVIGSTSKRRRFERLMKNQGIAESAAQRLVCPIGVSGIASKKPAEIAVGVVAELLQARDEAALIRSSLPFLEVSH
ncbi:MAG: xanthine dehydrogenase accessory protein XdhC, partial [Gammaproteobacteria bacterium]|nr:xanthine dehydrogenase accessory protein XdhC [Gammaproteobacteria bacterium]